MTTTDKDGNEIKVSVPDVLARIHGGPEAFVLAWKREPTVEKAAKALRITREEARAVAQAMRNAGVKLPKKYQGRTGVISKSMAEHLNGILGGKLTDDSKADLEDDDSDEEFSYTKKGA